MTTWGSFAKEDAGFEASLMAVVGCTLDGGGYGF
jgi:hypothetical protein